MVDFSTIQYSNDLGQNFLEETELLEISLEASAFGFIKVLALTLGSAFRNTPTLITGTHTGAGNSTTTLTDSAATFIRDGVLPGDQITNTTDSDATWDVVSVDSDTQLTVRLNTGGGGDDDFDTSDAYTLRQRNLEDAYVPFTTEVRAYGERLKNQLIFRGTVQEVLPGNTQGQDLLVLCVAHDEELRTGASQADQGAAQRSEIMQDVIDEQVSGAFLFPRVSAFEEAPGFEHSPSDDTLSPDFTATTRTALSSLITMAKSEAWCHDRFQEPATPAIEQAVTDQDNELVMPSAEGNLAQSFIVPSHMAISVVSLYLGTAGTRPVGNLYVRIESNDVDGEVGGAPGNDVPSGRLVTPWAESRLNNITGLTAGGAWSNFYFPEPISLDDANTYWIVLSYQEDNVTGYSAGVDYVRWFSNSAGGYGSGVMATYASNVWTITAGEDFEFRVYEFQDMYLFYDIGGDAWEDQLTEVISAAGSHIEFMDTVPAVGDSRSASDRVYIRTASPIRGLLLLLEAVAADPDYGDLTVRYYGDDGAKITGAHTGADNHATVLTDSDKEFRLTSVAVGDILHNLIDDCYGRITAIAGTTLTVGLLNDGTDDDWDTGDAYVVLNLELRASGTDDSGGSSATVLTDSGASFLADGVRIGDLVVNTTDDTVGVITAMTATALTAGAGNMDWDNGDAYRVLSRWRTLTLKDTDITFLVTGETVKLEWDLPPDWVATTFDVALGGVVPEASAPGATIQDLMYGYWLTLQVASIPATAAEVEEVQPIPGYGFTLLTADETHRDVVLAAAGVHDGANNASVLVDTGEDFISTHGLQIGDYVENLTDGSTGRITAFTSSGGANRYDQVVATLSGGTDDDWDIGDQYRVTRDRYKLNYFRNGSRPLGRPANYGLTLRSGAPSSGQVWPLLGGQFSRSGQPVVNRVTVIGRPGAAVSQTETNLRSQRELRRVIYKRITDYSVANAAEATDRALAEINRLSDRTNRGVLLTYGLPYFSKVLERQSWRQDGIALLHRLDGDIAASGTYEHDGAGNASALQDVSQNFNRWDVQPGDLVQNITDGSEASITGVSTTTNEGDTITHDTLTGGTDNDWDSADEYRVRQRRYVKVGDLIYVKVDDPDYIDDYYLVTGFKYSEPSEICELRVARNLVSPNVGDEMTADEMWANVADDAQQALQRGSY